MQPLSVEKSAPSRPFALIVQSFKVELLAPLPRFPVIVQSLGRE
jgi:hypothetical protein